MNFDTCGSVYCRQNKFEYGNEQNVYFLYLQFCVQSPKIYCVFTKHALFIDNNKSSFEQFQSLDYSAYTCELVLKTTQLKFVVVCFTFMLTVPAAAELLILESNLIPNLCGNFRVAYETLCRSTEIFQLDIKVSYTKLF